MPLVFFAHQFGAERGAGSVVHCRAGHGRAGRGGGYRHCAGHLGGAVHSVCDAPRAAAAARPQALGGGTAFVLGAVQPEHLHGADEQHRVGGVGGAAIRHQRSGHTDHCRAHRRAQAVLLYQYAADLHGKRRLHLCLPEPGRSPAGAGAQRECAPCTCARWSSWRQRWC